jgi:hypothetical protein
VRHAEKGPLVVHVASRSVQALTERWPSDVADLSVAVRERQPDGTWKDGSPLRNWTLPVDLWLDPEDPAALETGGP